MTAAKWQIAIATTATTTTRTIETATTTTARCAGERVCLKLNSKSTITTATTTIDKRQQWEEEQEIEDRRQQGWQHERHLNTLRESAVRWEVRKSDDIEVT